MAYDLDNKVVFITGASAGIGAAAARAFAKAGSKVVMTARRMDRLEELAREIGQGGREVLPLRCDVTDDGSVHDAVETAVRRFSGIDVLVNNAGIGLYGPVEELTPQLLQENFEVNVYGVVRCIREALPHLRRRGRGQIVNVSSVLGHRGLPGMGGYCAAKFALNGLTESLRVELKKDRIDVILLSPGVTATEFRSAAMTTGSPHESRAPFSAMSAEAVANALVQACRKQERQVVLTLTGRAMVEANRFAPALLDLVARRMVGPQRG